MNRPAANWPLALAVLLCLASTAPTAAPRERTVISKSRQYTVSSTVPNQRPLALGVEGGIPARVQLTPYKLAHFAENVKDHVLRQLQLPVQEKWSGRIHLNIFPGKLGEKHIFAKKRYLDGWRYRLDLPEMISGVALTRLIVAVQMEEFAARNAKTAPPMPPWLAEGLTERILHTHGPVMFVAFHSGAGGRLNHRFPFDPLAANRRIIQASPTISFLDLTLPPVELKTDAGRKMLRAHSHLLITKLLARPQGAAELKKFLRQLPQHKNSQHAFLDGFGFGTMLKAEQWWMLAQTQFRSRDAFNRWIPGLALTHLGDALQVRVPPKPALGIAPQPTLTTVQNFLRTATREDHLKWLNAVQQRLIVIQLHAPPKVAKLARDYRAILILYLSQKPNSDSKQAALLDITLRKLDELDVIRGDLKTVHAAEKERGKIIAGPQPR